MPGRFASTLLLILLLVPALEAQEPLLIPRLSGPIVLDGRSDEPAWTAVEPLPMTLHAPTFGGEPSERTEVRVAHDGEYLYLAGRLYDSDPSGIQGLSLKRDVLNLNNDYFGIILDTFGDRENALTFWTTPTGVRIDFSVSNDAEGGASNISWDTFWDVEVDRGEEGWFAEFRIPFSSLRFQEENGRVRMGLITWRSVARKNEYVIYPAIPPKWGFWSMFKPSQAQAVVLEGVRSTRPLYVTPYALGGGGRSFVLNAGGTAYDPADTPVREVGLDLKYGLTSNLTLDLTYNTDFAQVEADDQQINLTRFSLFFPERRLFFQERSSIFDFSTGGPNRLFYSRRIGMHAGQAVPIHGGARLVGRIGSWDVGAMTMQTARMETLPSENFGVLRLRRQVLNSNSYMGGMITSRIGSGGEQNLAYGLDGVVRLFGQDYLSLAWAQTFDSERESAASGLEAARVMFNWQRRTIDGLGYSLGYSRSGPAYEPGVGFELRSDYSRYGGGLSYGWRGGEDSPLLRHAASVDGALYQAGSDGSVESAELAPAWSIEWKSGHSLTFGGTGAYESLNEGFAIGEDAEIPAGDYRFGTGRVSYRMPAGKALRADASAEAGTFFDGRRTSLSLSPTWSASRHLELGTTYVFDQISFGERNQEFAAHVARLRARVMLSARLSASGFVQYNSAIDGAFANLRLRYNPREGRDLYVVYNAGMNTDRYAVDPVRPLVGNQTLLVKYSHAVDLGF